MKVVIFPAGPKTFASSRIRAYWLAKYWPAMEVHSQGPLDPQKYDIFIFQKVFWGNAVQDARKLRQMGKIVVWDLCDPMWWWYPDRHAQMAKEVAFAVASSANLAELAKQELGINCHFIADRHDPEFHPTAKIHSDTKKIRFVWFGYSGNRFTLNTVLPFLERLKAHGKSFELMVIDERPEVKMTGQPCPVIQKRWALDTFHKDMLLADVALLPDYPGPWGRYKSNNKETTAAWCGLPVVSGDDWDELCAVFNVEHRVELGKKGRLLAENNYDIRLSVKEWQELLNCHGETQSICSN